MVLSGGRVVYDGEPQPASAATTTGTATTAMRTATTTRSGPDCSGRWNRDRDPVSYPFMQRALIAALLTGLIAPAIGTYIVQRRLSLLGDGLGHVAIAGVGLAFLTGLPRSRSPSWSACSER